MSPFGMLQGSSRVTDPSFVEGQHASHIADGRGLGGFYRQVTKPHTSLANSLERCHT